MRSIKRIARYIAIPYTVLQIALLLTHISYIYTQSIESLSIDPAPLFKLLQDTLYSVLINEYGKAEALCGEALVLSLPTDIYSMHRKTYTTLMNIIDILIDIEAMKSKDSVNKTNLLAAIYRLEIARSDLEIAVTNYINKLSNMFIDQASRYIMTRNTMDSVANLDTKLRTIIMDLTQLYLHGEYGEELYIHIDYPDIVEGGSRYTVNISIVTRALVENINLTLISIYGGVVSREVSGIVSVDRSIAIEMIAPSAEELLARGINPLTIKDAVLMVIARASVENKTIGGHKLTNLSIVYRRPNIQFLVPNYVYPGQVIELQIISGVDAPLNLSIYLDRISSDTFITNTTIDIGENRLSIEIQNLSIGYHKLIFVTEAGGKYVPLVHSSVFAVVKHRVPVIADVSKFSIIPLAKPLINLYVDSPTLYSVNIYLDGKLVASYRHIDKPRFSISIDTPPTILFWRYSIYIEVKSEDPNYIPTDVEGYIYIVNLPVTTLTVLVVGIALTSPSSSRYIAISLRTLGSGVRRAISRYSGETTVIDIARPRFRKTKLGDLYRVFIALISRYIEPPKSSETLREFYTRFDRTVVKPVKSFVKKFLDIYEEDLYSNHDLDVSEAKKIVKRLKDLED
ncbi:MAG: hypothetical protein QW101_00305 [Ignisphaera sp.]|uniref:DUF4129 domain-containing protein n=1 Tax=Ignisphaera aggregans TaxID=334771 RepID=A0A7J3MZZ1_9CREN